MILSFKRLILLFLVFFSIPTAFALEGSCCYVPGVDSDSAIYPNIDLPCQNGHFTLGSLDDSNPTDLCKVFKDQRAACGPANSCSNTLDGNRLYDVPGLLDWLSDNGHATNIASCALVPFDSCTTSGPGVGVNPDLGGGDTGSGTDPGNQIVNPFEGLDRETPDPEEGQTVEVDPEVTQLCAQVGGPFGFFTSQLSCEVYEIDGVQSCMYNPHLSGYLSSDNSLSNIQLLDSESACVPKASIASCQDYKTRYACNLNAANGTSTSLLLEDGCRWIEYDSSSVFDEENGYCVSNYAQDKQLNKFYHANRLNLIKDPSFELNDGSWSGTGILRNDIAAFEGINGYELGASTSLTQLVEDVSQGSYIFHMYVRIDNLESRDLAIEVEIDDDNQGAVLVPINGPKLSDTFGNETFGYFEKLVFTPYVAPAGVEELVVSINTVGSGKVIVDGVNLEYAPFDSQGNPDLIYKPIQVISPEASSCELCYDPLNLNVCDEQRANSLGDCSYLVSGEYEAYAENSPEEYFGLEDNIYANERAWESQAFANGLLFCEMYTSQVSCTDENNYVNSKYGPSHTSRPGTLCQWKENYGCFKDSDGNRYPDTKFATPYYRDLETLTPGIKEELYENFEDYARSTEELLDNSLNRVSDFALACDTIPPTAYIYFTGVNSNGETIVLDSDAPSGETYGNVRMNGYINDFLPPACEDFNVDPYIIIDAEIIGEEGSEIFSSIIAANQERFNVLVKDYFVRGGESLITDGSTSINLKFLDQSGNLFVSGLAGLDNIGIDGSGPEIVHDNVDDWITDEQDVVGNLVTIDTILTGSSSFTFDVTDSSEVQSCLYTLESSTEIDSSKYTPSDSINLSEIEDLTEFSITLPLRDMIQNTTSLTGEIYTLGLQCTDLYGAKGYSKYYSFKADMRTEFVILEPTEFSSPEEDFGFFNEAQEFRAVSKDPELVSCTLEDEDGNVLPSTFEVNIPDEVDEGGNLIGFEIGTPELTGITFFANITGALEFSTEGRQDVILRCTDLQNNDFEMDLTYFWDLTLPTMLSYTFTERLLSDGMANLIYHNGNYYFRDSAASQSPEANFVVDGTNSWIDEQVAVRVPERFLPGAVSQTEFAVSLDYDNVSYISNFSVDNFEADPSIYDGEEVDEFVTRYAYELVLTDKAGNEGISEFEYYVDTSIAEVTFSGDVGEGDNNRLFSANTNPNIVVGFNSPAYREFTCTVTPSIPFFQASYPPSTYGPSNSLSFTLSDLNPALLESFEQGLDIELNFECEDQYGIAPLGGASESYFLSYDNVAPELVSFDINNGNPKYFFNTGIGANYPDIVDEFVFSFEDTNEQGYVCTYQVASSTHYACDNTPQTAEFGPGTLHLTETRNILDLGQSNSGLEPMCERTSPTPSGEVETSITLLATCQDLAGNLATAADPLVVEVIFTESSLVSPLNFRYEDGFAYPIVKSFQSLSATEFTMYREDLNLEVLTFTASAVPDGNGFYTYTSTNGVDLSDYASGEYPMRVDVVSAGIPLGSVSGNMIVDNVAPVLNLELPDAIDNEIYSTEFPVIFDGFDEHSGFGTIELFVDSTLVYSDDLSFDDTQILEPLDTNNYFSNQRHNYNGEVVYIAGEVGNTYTFTLRGTDATGNVREVSETVTILDGINIVLEASQDAAPNSQIGWVTQVGAPTLNFRTTDVVSSCSLWVPGYDPIILTGTQQFSKSLADFPGYDLESFEDRRGTVNINCLYEGADIPFVREVKFIKALPEYVVESSEGYVLTHTAFNTNLTVTSVGPYRPLESCSYTINSGSAVPLSTDDNLIFTGVVDFSSNTGSTTLRVTCENSFGVSGPVKEYEVIVSRDTIAISDLELVTTDHVHEVVGSEAYVQAGKEYTFELKTNERDATCRYQTADNIIDVIFNFIANLFGQGREDMSGANGPFEFKSLESFSVANGESLELTVRCSEGSDSTVRTVDITALDGSEEVEVNQVIVS